MLTNPVVMTPSSSCMVQIRKLTLLRNYVASKTKQKNVKRRQTKQKTIARCQQAQLAND